MKNIIGLNIWIFSPLLPVGKVFAQDVVEIYCKDANGNTIPNQINTALGCISSTPSGFFSKILAVSLGIAGGVAFLMILLGAIQIQTSAGNPEQLNQGREILEGAIIGLLLIILAVFILKVIGVDILAIPGFHS